MSVWIYKDDQEQLVSAEDLESSLAGGWSVTKGDNHENEEKANDEEKANGHKGQNEQSEEEANEEENGLLALQNQAKELGIKSWHRMSEETLKEKINEHQL